MSGIFERNILLNFSFISFSAMSGKISNHFTEGADKCGSRFFEMQPHLEATSEAITISTSSRTKISRERR